MIPSFHKEVSIQTIEEYQKLPADVKHQLFPQLNQNQQIYTSSVKTRQVPSIWKRIMITIKSVFKPHYNAAEVYTSLQGKVKTREITFKFEKNLAKKILDLDYKEHIKMIELFRQGNGSKNEKIRQEKFSEAEKICNERLSFDPKSLFYRSILAEAYITQSKFEKVLAVYKVILPKLENSDFQGKQSELEAISPLMLIGQAQIKLGAMKEAKIALEKALGFAKKYNDLDAVKSIQKMLTHVPAEMARKG